MDSPRSGQCSLATALTNESFTKRTVHPVALSKDRPAFTDGDSIKRGHTSGHDHESASDGEHFGDLFSSPWTVEDDDCQTSFFDPLDIPDISRNELFQELERFTSSERDFSSFDSDDWQPSIRHGHSADIRCMLPHGMPHSLIPPGGCNKKRCEECKKDFRYPKDLSRHLQSVHSLDRPYKCPMRDCNYHSMGFSRKDNQKRHISKKHPELVAVLLFEL